jgi:K+-transporting ATPase ATPase C chain
MFSQLKPAILLTLVLTVLLGIIYPLAITGIAQVLFPSKAHGSLIERGGRVIGSELIGQSFTKPGYFYGRPSAAGAGYDAAASGGSNLGPTSKVLMARIDSMTRALHAQNPAVAVPVELVTTSASGLDPHISPAAAEFQIPRVARERGIPQQAVRTVVARYTEGRDLGFLGEPRVNVLELNLALDSAR